MVGERVEFIDIDANRFLAIGRMLVIGGASDSYGLSVCLGADCHHLLLLGLQTPVWPPTLTACGFTGEWGPRGS